MTHLMTVNQKYKCDDTASAAAPTDYFDEVNCVECLHAVIYELELHMTEMSEAYLGAPVPIGRCEKCQAFVYSNVGRCGQCNIT